MKIFLGVLIVTWILQAVGLAVALQTGDLSRNPKLIPWDIGIAMGLAVWAAYLLANEP